MACIINFMLCVTMKGHRVTVSSAGSLLKYSQNKFDKFEPRNVIKRSYSYAPACEDVVVEFTHT